MKIRKEGIWIKSKIIKIEEEFVIVELNNGEQKVCPRGIFPQKIEIGCVVEIRIVKSDFTQ